jgi:fatty acid desaturase
MNTKSGSTRPLGMRGRITADTAHGRVNLIIGAAQIVGWASLITLLHGPGALWWKIPVLIVFCLMMQGVFSMMHECFHQHGHPSRRVNRLLGIASSTIFGTSYTLIRVNHEGHHVRNRTPAEMAEYILPGESAARKTLVYYFAILGGIWLGSCVAAAVLPLIPYRWAAAFNRPSPSMNGYSLSFAQFTPQDWRSIRQEGVVGVATWLAAILVFHWEIRLLACIYAAFAFSWSSLQWVYHMRTPLDPVEGAYDLRAPRLIRWLFLNFNYNLTHHRAPNVPWQQVHERVDVRETQPLWYRYLLVFKPPEPLPADPASIIKTYR